MHPGIYVHLPFCSVHCSYCDFPLTTRVSLSERYYAALLREMTLNPPRKPADTLYFGGGTPSLTPVELLRQIKQPMQLVDDAEITLEANPENVNIARLEDWLELGITRLSIGIQSMEAGVLRVLLRTHSAENSIQALNNARSSGFSNLNVDLMIGCPHQTTGGFLEGLQQLTEFHPEHFSLYLLEIHQGTALERQLSSGKITVMDEDTQIECYTKAIALLQGNGYEHYEVSNFALPGKQSNHNLKYWTNGEYYAYGAGAASYVNRIRTANIASIDSYIKHLEKGDLPVKSQTVEDPETVMRNTLIFGLRKTQGVDIEEFEANFHASPLDLFGDSASTFLDNGWLEIHGNRLRLTLSGMLLSNEILNEVV